MVLMHQRGGCERLAWVSTQKMPPPGCDDAREVLAFPQKLRIKRLSPEAAETLQLHMFLYE